MLGYQEGPFPVDTARKLAMLLAGYEMVRFTQPWYRLLCVKDVGSLYPEPAMGLYRVRYEASNFRIGSNDMPINGGMLTGGGVK
jgi:hypothetical protein